MAIVVGGLVGLGLLYFWLLGHWFARVVMMPVLALALGVGMSALMASAEHAGPNNGLFGLLVGIALAWPAASAPVYYWRWRFSRPDASLELALR